MSSKIGGGKGGREANYFAMSSSSGRSEGRDKTKEKVSRGKCHYHSIPASVELTIIRVHASEQMSPGETSPGISMPGGKAILNKF